MSSVMLTGCGQMLGCSSRTSHMQQRRHHGLSWVCAGTSSTVGLCHPAVMATGRAVGVSLASAMFVVVAAASSKRLRRYSRGNRCPGHVVRLSLPSDVGARPKLVSLPDFLASLAIDTELIEVLCAVADATREISERLAVLPIVGTADTGGAVNVQGETQAGMDVVSNQIFVSKLASRVAAIASEEETVVIQGTDGRQYEIAFDPLDGSSNLDSGLPTGSIFGIAPYKQDQPFSGGGRSLIAAGYALYSSSTELVVSIGKKGAAYTATGFTLDPSLAAKLDAGDGECFILSRPDLACPHRGPYYSLNDAREPDWPAGLRRWVHDAKRGQVPSGTKFSARYSCALVADVHRALLQGGWAGNPRPHLRLLYEAAPLAHIAEACGGRGSDGVRDLLDIVPTGLHDRVCVFIGSAGDVTELEEYGDVQQAAAKYAA